MYILPGLLHAIAEMRKSRINRGIFFSGLPTIAAYCGPGGVKVVSPCTPIDRFGLYPRNLRLVAARASCWCCFLRS